MVARARKLIEICLVTSTLKVLKLFYQSNRAKVFKSLRRGDRVSGAQHRLEDVSDAESVDGHVPRLPELEDVVGVPPSVVELAVGEAQQLPAQVEDRVEDQVEPRQPDHVVGDLEIDKVILWYIQDPQIKLVPSCMNLNWSQLEAIFTQPMDKSQFENLKLEI